MKITIESTERTVLVNSVPARVWEGKTESGIEVVCLITRIAAPSRRDLSEFDRELKECKPASSMGVEAFPSKMVI